MRTTPAGRVSRAATRRRGDGHRARCSGGRSRRVGGKDGYYYADTCGGCAGVIDRLGGRPGARAAGTTARARRLPAGRHGSTSGASCGPIAAAAPASLLAEMKAPGDCAARTSPSPLLGANRCRDPADLSASSPGGWEALHLLVRRAIPGTAWCSRGSGGRSPAARSGTGRPAPAVHSGGQGRLRPDRQADNEAIKAATRPPTFPLSPLSPGRAFPLRFARRFARMSAVGFPRLPPFRPNSQPLTGHRP